MDAYFDTTKILSLLCPSMLYTKIKNTSFIASNHYNTHLKLDYQPTFIFPKHIHIPKKTPSSIQSTSKYNIRYNDFKKINEISKTYMLSLKKNASPDIFLSQLYNAELTGALVRINGKTEKGYVVEERLNTIFVVYEDDRIKMYVKKLNNFAINVDGVEYIFFGQNLKTNRFSKKK